MQPNTYNSSKHTGWVFIAILSLSICTYSGFTANAFSEHRQAVRTEIIVTDSDQIERITTYNQLKADLLGDNRTAIFNSWTQVLSLFHDRIARVRLKAASDQVLDFEPFVPFPISKNTTTDTDQETPPLVG